jgi:hypothetical protein
MLATVGSVNWLMFNEAKHPDDDPAYAIISEKSKNQEMYFFPTHSNGEHNKEHLIVSLQMASLLCGFVLILKLEDPEQKRDWKIQKLAVQLAIGCRSSQVYWSKKSFN